MNECIEKFPVSVKRPRAALIRAVSDTQRVAIFRLLANLVGHAACLINVPKLDLFILQY